jgi:hypothetical protein
MTFPIGSTQILVFEIPYGIRANDGFHFEQQDDRVELELQGREEATEIQCRIGDVFAWLRFEQNVHQEGMFFDGQFNIEGERLGKSLSSTVLIHFSEEFIDAIPEKVIQNTPENYHEQGTIIGSKIATPLDKHLIVWGVNFLNKFLNYYRFFENEYWIQPLTPQMIQKFHLWRNTADGFDRHRVRNWIGGPIRGGGADIETIQEAALSTMDLPLVQKLQLDARDNIDRSNYAIGVIQSGQLLELWSQYAFIIIAKQRGHTEKQAKELIKFDSDRSIKPPNIFDKYRKELGYDFKSTDQFDDWNENTRKLRNNVVHEGYEPTRSEASEAFKGTMEAILEIQNHFRSELEGGQIDDHPDQPLQGSNILMSKGENPDPPE